MRKTMLLIISTLLMNPAGAVHINEVMYNPEGNDNNREFVELFVEDNRSLEDWVIADSESNDTLVVLQFLDSQYAVIVEEGYSVNSSASYYTTGPSIGNNLNNVLDEISIYDEKGNLVDFMSYDGKMADNNGKSLELYNGSWRESTAIGGTPGVENSVPDKTNTPRSKIISGHAKEKTIYLSATERSKNMIKYLLCAIGCVLVIIIKRK